MAVMPLSLLEGDLQHCVPYRPQTMVDDMDRKERFAYALREVMRFRGFTQERLAQAVGRSPQTVRRWCSGEYSPSVLEVAGLADVLGVDDRYFTRPPEPQPYPLRDFLTEVTAAAEAEGQGRETHQDQDPPPAAPHSTARGRRPRPRSSGQ